MRHIWGAVRGWWRAEWLIIAISCERIQHNGLGPLAFFTIMISAGSNVQLYYSVISHMPLFIHTLKPRGESPRAHRIIIVPQPKSRLVGRPRLVRLVRQGEKNTENVPPVALPTRPTLVECDTGRWPPAQWRSLGNLRRSSGLMLA